MKPPVFVAQLRSMHLRPLIRPLIAFAAAWVPLACGSAAPGSPSPAAGPLTLNTIVEIQRQIAAVRNAGHPRYLPTYVYVVNPASQRLHVLSAESFQVLLTLPAGTGAAGVGFGDGQTPPGFFTMGGVRIARNASSDIQTGDKRPGVSGVYAELLYPPQHPDKSKVGTVPINVVIHSFNPRVSEALRRRYEDGLIGKKPCTTGCPVVHPRDAGKLVPYLKKSAGSFDPATRPGPALSRLIRSGMVREHTGGKLFEKIGDPIYIMDPRSPATPAG